MGLRSAIARLLPEAVRSSIYDWMYSPAGIKLGKGSRVVKPRYIRCPERITLGNRCHIQPGATFFLVDTHHQWRYDPAFTLADDVYIGSDFHVECAFGVRIGKGSALSDRVYLNDHNRDVNPAIGNILRLPLITKGPIEIGESTWIGYGSIILSGVKLGSNCVVAAGSVVTKSFPDFSVIGGNPARLIRSLATGEAAEPEVQITGAPQLD